MRYFGGMDRDEIAAVVGMTVSTVKRDLRLGEAWLRRFLAGPQKHGIKSSTNPASNQNVRSKD
jgi:DNA-directed RNA polymerase specialized sigma24 family protein